MTYCLPNLTVLRVREGGAPPSPSAATPYPAWLGRAGIDGGRVADVAAELSGVVRSLLCFRQLLIAPSDRLRVLVVGHGARRRAPLSAALHAQHDVIEASGYADALVRLATEVLDAVVVEPKIGPIGSGAALLTEMRDRWPLLRRVLVASGSHVGSHALVQAGIAHHVLPQPLDRSALLASVRPEQLPARASKERAG